MNYKDILPSDPRLEQIRSRSHQARILGEVFHLLKSHPTEEGYEQIHVFASDDKIQPITEIWKDVEEALYTEQLEKDVDRLKDTQTKLELLEDELERLGSNAKGRTAKEELQGKMEIYLKALLEKQDASVGKAGREYQEHLAVIHAFRNKYNLGSLGE